MIVRFEGLITLFKLNAEQLANIKILYNEAIKAGVNDKRKFAYMLATWAHECAYKWKPIKEFGSVQYFIKKYWLNSRVARWLGNDDANDAAKYFGRGNVQITGEGLYEKAGKKLKIDLLNNPDLALNIDVACKIMVYGMIEGWFTGVKLSNYFNDKWSKPVGARAIINGKDKQFEIAKIYENIMKVI